ncbi:MAG: hypothetical protein WCL71_13515, partial [Deltaproteobacteria bacterium]
SKAAISGTSYNLTSISAIHALAVTFELIPDSTLPTITITAPTSGSSGSSLTSVNGTSSDNIGVSKIEVQLYNSTTKLYVDATGSNFVSNAAWIQVPLSGTVNNWQTWSLITTSYTNTINGSSTADGLYNISARATDIKGNVSNLTTTTFARGTPTTISFSKSPATGGTLTITAPGTQSKTCDTKDL